MTPLSAVCKVTGNGTGSEVEPGISTFVCVPCKTVMSASGLRVSLPQDRAVLELVKALVLLLLTLSVCTAVVTLPQCSLSECKRKLRFSLLCCTTL